MTLGREVTLEDKYEQSAGEVYLSGVQALVRMILDQIRADRAAGLRTGTMVSGYQGSPLGGLDLELGRVRARHADLDIHFQPGLNEELGATAVWGSQLVPSQPQATVDGVVGWWYGKAPGVDRSADALRHGNFVGAGPRGGLVALVGEDPQSKSSTLPSATEGLLASLGMPVLFPGSVQEALDLGRHAVALSRASGLWATLKMVTSVADATATASVGLDRVEPVMPRGGYVHRPSGSLLAPDSIEMEASLHGPRLALARAYGRDNHLNRIRMESPDARLGIVAAGSVYHDLREALHTLGVEDGVRVLQVQMLWPLEPTAVRDFARGLDEIVVLEEKGPFLATAVREALYDLAVRPPVHGSFESTLDPDAIARTVGPYLAERPSVQARLDLLAALAPTASALGPVRTPFFCSGCPHNRSTDAPDDAEVGLGIGCHTMVLVNQAGKGQVTGLTQMGGEGTQWIGQAPFTKTGHLFQNLGDGTFHHSGSLAVRAAVAAGVNITYKLLYNRAVAMTGGQDVEGVMTVDELIRWFELEGVKRVEVTTGDTGPAELMRLQRELAKESGVTVLIHDQMCAAEKRRAVKRGRLPKPSVRIAINERVCEGCGDCGAKSKCLSVLPKQTEFGRRTQIHQPSCNSDLSCLEGDCPSFLEVIPGERSAHRLPEPPGLPEPVIAPGGRTIRMMGIGGTGVVTMAQIVGMAALLDGKQVRGLDQTGLAQKGGPVVSDLRILDADAGTERTNRQVAGGVDAYLGFDLLGAAAPANLFTADPERTVAVVSTHRTPTGSMVVDPTIEFAALTDSLDVIDRHVREAEYFDAQALAESLFRDDMPANSLLLGAAWQRGLIPLSLEALEAAIRINGAAVDKTLAAFAWGRAVVAAPGAVEAATRVELPEPSISEAARSLAAGLGGGLGALVARRAQELIAYQSEDYAAGYADFVRCVAAVDPSTAMTESVARHLFKVMAYKDEYEVARLHLDVTERARLAAEFGDGARIAYKLHPPVLRALGMERKITLGPKTGATTFRVLRGMKRLRGTAFDPFARAEVRRVERALPDEYRALVEQAIKRIGTADYELLVELCDTPDLVRGYEDIKLAGVERFRARAQELLARLDAPTPLLVVQRPPS